VQIGEAEQAAHEARLEKLRKKAGKALWDELDTPAMAETAIA